MRGTLELKDLYWVASAALTAILIGGALSIGITWLAAEHFAGADARKNPLGFHVTISCKGDASAEARSQLEQCLDAGAPGNLHEIAITEKQRLLLDVWSTSTNARPVAIRCIRDVGLAPQRIEFGRNISRTLAELLSEPRSILAGPLVSLWLASLALCLPLVLIIVGVIASLRNHLALRPKPTLGRIAAGAAGGLVLTAGGFVLAQVMEALASPLRESASVFAALNLQGLFLAVVVVAMCFVAPVGEEVFFRGYVFQLLLRGPGRPLAYGVSSTLFALLHLHPAGIPYYLLAGLVLAFLTERAQSVVPAIVAHSIANVVGVILLLSA